MAGISPTLRGGTPRRIICPGILGGYPLGAVAERPANPGAGWKHRWENPQVPAGGKKVKGGAAICGRPFEGFWCLCL